MKDFEWYRPLGREGKSYISLAKYRIGFSKKLAEEMCKPKYVQLGYSNKDKSMAIKPLPSLHIENNKYGIKTTLVGINSLRIANRGFIRFLISKGIIIENQAKKFKAIWDRKDKICYVNFI